MSLQLETPSWRAHPAGSRLERSQLTVRPYGWPLIRGGDTNILVYAHRDETAQYRKALQVFRELATDSEPWVSPWPCIYEFLPVVTHPRVFHPPTPLDEAWRAVESLLDSPSRVRLAEGERHREILAELIRASAPEGNVLHDAHIAAVLIEHRAYEIIKADEAFRRFRWLKVVNPFHPSGGSALGILCRTAPLQSLETPSSEKRAGALHAGAGRCILPLGREMKTEIMVYSLPTVMPPFSEWPLS